MKTYRWHRRVISIAAPTKQTTDLFILLSLLFVLVVIISMNDVANVQITVQRSQNAARQPALIFPTSWPNAGPMRTMRPMRCFVGPHRFVYVLRYASWLSKTPHFAELRTPVGAMTPKFELCRDFCAIHIPPSFTVLCLLVRKSSCWQTNTPRNKQTPPKTSNVLRYATTLGKDRSAVGWQRPWSRREWLMRSRRWRR